MLGFKNFIGYIVLVLDILVLVLDILVQDNKTLMVNSGIRSIAFHGHIKSFSFFCSVERVKRLSVSAYTVKLVHEDFHVT